MNTNENAGPTAEIGEANFDREVRNATQSVLVEVRNQLYRHETRIFLRPWRRLMLPPTCNDADSSALKSKRGAQSQADGLCQGPANLARHKQTNYENTQNPKHTKSNRFKPVQEGRSPRWSFIP